MTKAFDNVWWEYFLHLLKKSLNDFRQTVVLNAQASLKAGSRVGWPNSSLKVLELFSP